jgi:hypothetical protein
MPGRGGDAGSVEFHFVNSRPSDARVLVLASSVKGGRPAQRFLKRTPSWAALNSDKSRNAFRNEVSIPNIESLFGKDGNVTIDYMGTNQALNVIGKVLIEASMGRNYSITMILQRARTDANPSLDPRDGIRDFLIEELRYLQSELLQAIPLSVTAPTEASHTIRFTPLFSTLQCDRSGLTTLSDQALTIIDSICQFRRLDHMDSVQSYFVLTGGILRANLNDIRPLEYCNSMSKDLVDMKGP